MPVSLVVTFWVQKKGNIVALLVVHTFGGAQSSALISFHISNSGAALQSHINIYQWQPIRLNLKRCQP